MALMNRQLYLAARPEGVPDHRHVQCREVPVCAPGAGEVLIQNLYLSLDPAIRGWMSDKPSYMPPIPLGGTVRSSTLGRVIASRHPEHRAGDLVVGLACNGWEDFSVTPGEQLYRVEADSRHPLSYHLSIFSAVGLTPYFGVMEIGQPRPGQTMLVSAAAGAVGSLAGQIARLQGCRAVGLAGTDEKCRWIREELGYDAAINYRSTDDLHEALTAACPQGIDIYFDNVGGTILDAALMHMNEFGRVVFCGAIAQYNTETPVPGPYNYWQILARSLTVRGFISPEFRDRFDGAREQMKQWLDSGQLRFAEEITDGLEHAVTAFARLFSGANQGKTMVRIRAEDSVPPTLQDLNLAP